MVLNQLKHLINLAHIDGGVGEKEEKYIYNIGAANGVSVDTIRPLLSSSHDTIVPTDLTNDQKFDYIFSLVQLMKIDERLYKEEIRYCSKVASKLGYNQNVMFDLMLHVRSVMKENEMEELKKLTAKYLGGKS
ncbi:MAG TPA: TerB family tellurite resistance protein [Cyclobacteriaceae bacterium]